MGYFIFKIFLTALIIVSVSELGRRYTFFAAALASLPLTSILAFVWLYHDTQDTQKIIDLSYDIFWLVIPSLLFFLFLPFLLKQGVNFYSAMILSSLAMSVGYGMFYFKM